MSDNGASQGAAIRTYDVSGRLSYKFQRLREQIRRSVLNGEFNGRLPGERELGRKYKANAKTINKALCDLSSEGLLVRQIGRGTFVAEGTGKSRGHSARGPILCILPAAGADVVPYRRIVLNHLHARLAQGGHRLEVTALPYETAARGNISLKAWAPAVRASTAGLVAYPHNPLSGGSGRLGDDCMAEAYRRRVPMVSLGAFADTAKIDAVVPDYMEAGFRLAEYLALLGCTEITALSAGEEGREAKLVMNGCQTAAVRHGRSVTTSTISSMDWRGLLENQSPKRTAGQPESSKEDSSRAMGLVCIGSGCLRTLLENQSLRTAGILESAVIACIPEPGDTTAQEANLTAYEVDPQVIGVWAADLIVEARPGRVPIEVIIPGELKIRGRAARPQTTLRHSEAAPDSRHISAVGGATSEMSI
ncbi:MAG TPA: GntR family transcriptional regulator [Phycisphaerae bacterium]|nr:GntR family transcriptional regulator [Phycisphaerae bacterium]